MEENLPYYIELIDSTPQSHNLIIRIYNIVRIWIRSLDWHQEVCESLLRKYRDLYELEIRYTTENEWRQQYYDFKALKEAIRNRTIEQDLNDQQRRANQQLIDSLLFYIHLIIVGPLERAPPAPLIHMFPHYMN